MEATPKNLNDLKLQKANDEKVAKEQYEEALALKTKIEEAQVNLKIKAGEGGRTFGSVSSKEISQAAKEQLSLELDKKKIHLSEPIKTVGTHNVTVKLHPKVSAELKVKVSEA